MVGEAVGDGVCEGATVGDGVTVGVPEPVTVGDGTTVGDGVGDDGCPPTSLLSGPPCPGAECGARATRVFQVPSSRSEPII